MKIWECLGIESTNDISIIKKAYADKIKNYHPEDDIEKFMELKDAYKAAIRFAKYQGYNSFPHPTSQVRLQENRSEPIVIEHHEEFEIKRDPLEILEQLIDEHKKSAKDDPARLIMVFYYHELNEIFKEDRVRTRFIAYLNEIKIDDIHYGVRYQIILPALNELKLNPNFSSDEKDAIAILYDLYSKKQHKRSVKKSFTDSARMWHFRNVFLKQEHPFFVILSIVYRTKAYWIGYLIMNQYLDRL